LLPADVEGWARLWQTQPDEMSAAVARLDRAVCDLVAAHNGVRPVEQGERLVSEEPPNKDIAARLFVSSRTLQAHLSQVYSKLGLSSRVQLAQEASRHA
jgi:FixJ family two-component response regulator